MRATIDWPAADAATDEVGWNSSVPRWAGRAGYQNGQINQKPTVNSVRFPTTPHNPRMGRTAGTCLGPPRHAARDPTTTMTAQIREFPGPPSSTFFGDAEPKIPGVVNPFLLAVSLKSSRPLNSWSRRETLSLPRHNCRPHRE